MGAIPRRQLERLLRWRSERLRPSIHLALRGEQQSERPTARTVAAHELLRHSADYTSAHSLLLNTRDFLTLRLSKMHLAVGVTNIEVVHHGGAHWRWLVTSLKTEAEEQRDRQ